MSEDWFYLEAGQSKGPETEAGIARLLVGRTISSATLVWSQLAPEWVPLSKAFPALVLEPPPLPTAAQMTVSDLAIGAGDRPPLHSRDETETSSISRWRDMNPHPWRRYFARTLDQILSGLLGLIVFSVIMAEVAPGTYRRFLAPGSLPDNALVLGWIAGIMAIPINAIFIGFSGVTIGKWLFGVRVLGPEGKPMGFVGAVHREILVWFKGLAMGIPVIALVTYSIAHASLTKSGATSWDRDLRLVVRYRSHGMAQVLLTGVGICTLLAALVALNAR